MVHYFRNYVIRAPGKYVLTIVWFTAELGLKLFFLFS